MSMGRAWWVVCDVCHTDHDEHNWRASEARTAALDDGWHRSYGRDVCPHCWDQGAR